MHYLSPDEKKQVTYSNHHAFPPRPLTDIEKQIQRIILVQSLPAEGKGGQDTKREEINWSLHQLKTLTANSRLSDKVKAALETPEKFDEFTEGYPYAKYTDYINGSRKRSTLVQLAADGFKGEYVHALMRWVNKLCLAFYTDLPKGIDTFIWTPHTRHYKTHTMAKATGDKAFYGYTLPADTQRQVNELFGQDGSPLGSLWAMHHVRRTELHKDRTVWERFGFNEIAKETFDNGLEINFGYDSVYLGPFSAEPYWFLELRQESTNTRLRFIIEG
jgi:hypothetical protein